MILSIASKRNAVPLFNWLLLGEVVAHIRVLQIYIASVGCYAVQYGVGYQLPLYSQKPLIRLKLRGYERGAAVLARPMISTRFSGAPDSSPRYKLCLCFVKRVFRISQGTPNRYINEVKFRGSSLG